MKKSLSLFLIILLFLSFSACEDDPSSVGEDLLEGQDLTNLRNMQSIISESKESYIDSINLGSAGRTLIGKTEDLTSTGLLRFSFSLPDSIETEMDSDNLEIVSATIILRPTYYFGEESGNWEFGTHEVTRTWGYTEFNTDSLAVIPYNSEDLGSNLQFVDDTTITFEFDKNITYQWMQHSTGDTTVINNGIIFVPAPACSRVIGFPALLSVSDDSYLPQLEVIVESPGEFVDTLFATLINDAYAVEGSIAAPPENMQYIQGGLPVRTNVKFDLSGLSQNAIVVDAVLTMHTDTLSSDYGSKGTDTLVVSLLTDFEENTVEEDNNIYSFILVRDGNTFTGNMRRYVQHWLDDTENQGMQIRVSDEDKALTRIALYESAVPDTTLKPRIQIIYTDVK